MHIDLSSRAIRWIRRERYWQGFSQDPNVLIVISELSHSVGIVVDDRHGLSKAHEARWCLEYSRLGCATDDRWNIQRASELADQGVQDEFEVHVARAGTPSATGTDPERRWRARSISYHSNQFPQNDLGSSRPCYCTLDLSCDSESLTLRLQLRALAGHSISWISCCT